MESLGRSVLERYSERLKASTVDIAEFACKLRVKGLITDADVVRALNKNVPASEQWGDLVATITKSSTQGVFQKFIDTLLEERELQQLGKEMKELYLQSEEIQREQPHLTATAPTLDTHDNTSQVNQMQPPYLHTSLQSYPSSLFSSQSAQLEDVFSAQQSSAFEQKPSTATPSTSLASILTQQQKSVGAIVSSPPTTPLYGASVNTDTLQVIELQQNKQRLQMLQDQLFQWQQQYQDIQKHPEKLWEATQLRLQLEHGLAEFKQLQHITQMQEAQIQQQQEQLQRKEWQQQEQRAFPPVQDNLQGGTEQYQQLRYAIMQFQEAQTQQNELLQQLQQQQLQLQQQFQQQSSSGGTSFQHFSLEPAQQELSPAMTTESQEASTAFPQFLFPPGTSPAFLSSTPTQQRRNAGGTVYSPPTIPYHDASANSDTLHLQKNKQQLPQIQHQPMLWRQQNQEMQKHPYMHQELQRQQLQQAVVQKKEVQTQQFQQSQQIQQHQQLQQQLKQQQQQLQQQLEQQQQQLQQQLQQQQQLQEQQTSFAQQSSASQPSGATLPTPLASKLTQPQESAGAIIPPSPTSEHGQWIKSKQPEKEERDKPRANPQSIEKRDLQSLSSDGEEHLPIIPSGKKHCEEFFSVFGLTNFYPQKLSLQQALEIREDTLECVKHLQDTSSRMAYKKFTQKSIPLTDPMLYPFLILQRIMAFDYTCRTKFVLSSQFCSDEGSLIRMLSRNKRTGGNTNEFVVHPMDGLLAVLHCANNFLRQDLISRLATCQLAVPLLLPAPFEPDKVTFLIWALRSIVREWQLPNGKSREGQLVCSPSPLVSFLRIGNFEVSKSYIMNIVISTSKHDVFFQYNCGGGRARRLLVNGLVEVSWYLPSKRDMIFSDLITFANLHGDASEYPKQVQFLSKVSFMNFVFISEKNRNDEALHVLKTLAAAPGGLVLLLVDSSDDDDLWYEWLESTQESVKIINLAEKNEAEYCDEVREEINSKINERWNEESKFSLEKCCDVAHFCDIMVDEDEDSCMEGKELAAAFEKIIKEFRRTHRTESLKSLLPLQGCDHWHEWALTDKEQYRQTQRGQCDVNVYGQQQRQKMENIRKKQFDCKQHKQPLMNLFLTPLLSHKGETRHYFLHWIRLFLDNLAREQLPGLHTRYRDKVLELHTIQSEGAERACKAEIQKLNKQIIDASFGLEHLLREVSQIYEAVAAQKQESIFQKHTDVLHLPQVAAELMIEGYPLELMDGDAAHVPITWVLAVLAKVQELLGNPKLFVLSVLGIQSSGKSTLLNTVFGVQFSTSAGRCTRGAFMQLLPIHSSLRDECQCDYFLIVDTEGLRAPELAEQTHKHDNEIATFVIGQANLTIINLSGETVGDMDDILQTAVHAFLRMRTVNLKPSCHFVHQNVTAVQAGEKTMMGRMKFKESLDMKTQAAAKEEGLEDKYKHFTDVINFDNEKHVFHFQNLWKGDPPMAPVNPGYSTNAQFLKHCLITLAKKADSNDLQVFQRHLKELWKAILHENFVFSFRNTLEVTAYNTLDGAYGNWSWQFKQDMISWEQKAHNRMTSCKISVLPSVYDECVTELPKHVHDIHQKLTEEMNSFFKKSVQQEIIIKWKGEMETRLMNLKGQLEQQAENHCKFWKTNRQALAKVDEMRVTHRGFILDHVKHLASQLERGTLTDKELDEKFNEQWIKCINDIKLVPVHMVHIDVRGDVQKCLTGFEPLKRCQAKLIVKLDKKPLGKGDYSLQLAVRDVHVKKRPAYLLKVLRWGSDYPISEGQEITTKLFQHQRDYLLQMKKQDYNPDLATELLRKLFEEIPKNSTDVTFTEEYKVDMALAVCRHALVNFQEMVDAERKRNDPVAYLERELREPFLKIFKDEYHQTAREITAAASVCDLLVHSVRKAVLTSLNPSIANGMRGDNSHLQSKPALKAKILLDIGEELDNEGDFGVCLCYLKDVKTSLKFWLEKYTLQYCHEGKLTEIALTEVTDIVGLIRNKVGAVSMEFSQKTGEFKITEWLTKFHSEIQYTGRIHLDIEELRQLGGVHQLKDVSHFTEEVMRGLRILQSKLETEFQNMSPEEMDSGSKKPQDYLLEELAGCTEQCPFCKEQCDLTNPDHYPTTKHSCAIHRPRCLGGYRHSESDKMVLDTCTTGVAGERTFRNCDTGWEVHPYSEYNKIYPAWSIPADLSLQASIYWKWLLGNYASEVAEAFEMKETDILEEWENLEWDDVEESLKDTFNV